MNAEGVFAVGVSGMGPALSPQGERIVNAKMEARNRVLNDLERRGLNVDALAHRPHACVGDHDRAAELPADSSTLSGPDALTAAHARIRAQERQLEHLQHLLAVQENKMLLLREALEAARSETHKTR